MRRLRAIRGAPEDDDRVNSEIHSEAVIKLVWRRNWRPRLGELRDALGGRVRASLEMHLETEIERTLRCTGRPWLSEFGLAFGCRYRVNSEMHSELWSSESRDALAAGYDRGRLEEYLEVVDPEAVDGRRARCWDSIHQLVNSKPWECDEVTLPLKLTWNRDNEGTTNNLRCMLYSVYAVLGVCCTRRMLLSVLTHDDGMERLRGMT